MQDDRDEPPDRDERGIYWLVGAIAALMLAFFVWTAFRWWD